MAGGSTSVGSRAGAPIADDGIVVESLQDLSKSASGGYHTLTFGPKGKRGASNKKSVMMDKDIESDEVLERLRSKRKKKDRKGKKRKAKKGNKKAKREEEIVEPPVQQNEEAPPVRPADDPPKQIHWASIIAQLVNHHASQGNEPAAERLRTVDVLIEGLDLQISILQDELNGLMEERHILVDELAAAAGAESGAGDDAHAGPNVPEDGHDGQDGHIDLNVASDEEMLQLRL